jgi:hypothetical protein
MKKDEKYNQNAGPNLIAYYLKAHLKHLICCQQISVIHEVPVFTLSLGLLSPTISSSVVSTK